MNILSLLTKEKHVAGIEINNQFIRIAYFKPRKKESKKLPSHELILIEEPIDTNIIKNGCVVDKVLLGKILKDIWTKSKLNKDYAIVSIPENKIYSHIFPFPKTVNEAHLKDAINLAIDFQLPVKKSDVYLGYENAGDSHVVNEVLISTIPKTVADGYIESLNYAGIKVLALESHLASIARSIKLKIGQATLLTKENPDGTTIFILKDGIIIFSRFIPVDFSKEENFIKNEINRIKTSFESEKKIPITEIPLISANIKDEYLIYPEIINEKKETQSKWLIALGTAIRGDMQRRKDNRISLLPVSTTEAYGYQKNSTFIILMRNIIIGISLFFVFTFLAAYFFIFSLSQKINQNISEINFSSTNKETLQKEELIKRINSITQAGKEILYTTLNWDILLEEISSHTINGIIVSNFSVNSINDPILITGIAKDRNTLNEFKKSLQSSALITSIELPINNLEQKSDIPFSLSFRLKDPNMLHYK